MRLKKLGALGVILMGLHILFHVVECLLLPSLLVAFGGRLAVEDAAATNQTGESRVIKPAELRTATTYLRPFESTFSARSLLLSPELTRNDSQAF